MFSICLQTNILNGLNRKPEMIRQVQNNLYKMDISHVNYLSQ